MNAAFNKIQSTMKDMKPMHWTAASTAVGALYGAVAGEDSMSGAIRGAVAGAAIGGGASFGAQKWKGLKDKYGFKPMLGRDHNDEMFEDTADLLAGIIKNPTMDGITPHMDKFAQKNMMSASNIDPSKMNAHTRNLHDNIESFKNLSKNGTKGERAGYLAGGFIESQLNLINSHFTKPATDTIKKIAKGDFKNISLDDAAATAATAYGGYEALGVGKDIVDGNYVDAATGVLRIGAMKNGYMAARGGVRMANALHKRGVTVGEAMTATKKFGSFLHEEVQRSGGYAAVGKQFADVATRGAKTVSSGVNEWVNTGGINKTMKGVG